MIITSRKRQARLSPDDYKQVQDAWAVQNKVYDGAIHVVCFCVLDLGGVSFLGRTVSILAYNMLFYLHVCYIFSASGPVQGRGEKRETTETQWR